MTTTTATERYLNQLLGLIENLPKDEKVELVSSIREHLGDAEDRDDLVATLNRLGTPEEVADAAWANSRMMPAAPQAWLPGATAAVVVATIIGFTILGSMMSVTAWFDDDADWNLHPAAALAGIAAGILVGVFTSVVVLVSRSWSGTEKMGLIALWVSALVVAVAGSEVAASTAPGTGFFIAGAQLLLGGICVLATTALALKARSRRTPR